MFSWLWNISVVVSQYIKTRLLQFSKIQFENQANYLSRWSYIIVDTVPLSWPDLRFLWALYIYQYLWILNLVKHVHILLKAEAKAHNTPKVCKDHLAVQELYIRFVNLLLCSLILSLVAASSSPALTSLILKSSSSFSSCCSSDSK